MVWETYASAVRLAYAVVNRFSIFEPSEHDEGNTTDGFTEPSNGFQRVL